jgi:serine protease Do
MKWPPNKGYKNQDIKENSFHSYSRYSLFNSTSQVAKMIFCFICTGMFLSGDCDRLQVTIPSASPQRLATKITQVASDISVRILNQDFLGSGFIVQHNNQEYFVITNQHVLRAGEPPYTIETFDGSTYQAEVITPINSSGDRYDLAILKFKADTDYKTAKIGSSSSLKVGESVFAAGFPSPESISPRTAAIWAQSNIFSPRKLSLKPGKIAIILDRALTEGYQIGYTNDVKKGMSGGPLLNSQGEVIGINGKHAYPLWEVPEIYQDGSELCPALQKLVTRSSLAIPIEKTRELSQQLKSLKPLELEDSGQSIQSNLSEKDRRLAAKMQAEAAATQLQCDEENSLPLRF